VRHGVKAVRSQAVQLSFRAAPLLQRRTFHGRANGGCCMRTAWARVESTTMQGFEDNSVLSRTQLRNRAVRHDHPAHRSRPAAMLLGTGLCGAGYNGAEHGSVTIPVFW
jgi:hypothetical protein